MCTYGGNAPAKRIIVWPEKKCLKSSFSITYINIFVALFYNEGHDYTQEAAAEEGCSGSWISLPVLKNRYNILTLKQWMIDRLRDDRGCYCRAYLNVNIDLELLSTEFSACSKPPSRENYRKASYPRT